MRFHHGSRLKNLVSKTPKKLKDISQLSGVPLSSLHDMFKKEEILPKKIEPVLKVLEVSFEDFMQSKSGGELKEIKKQLEDCQAENLKLSKQLIEVQAQLIAVQVPKKK